MSAGGSRGRLITPAVARLIFICGVLLVWEAACRLTSVSPILIAPPSEVLYQMARIVLGLSDVPDFYGHVATTLSELLIAYSIAVVLGVGLGVVFASSKMVGDAFEPILLAFYAVPKVILYPLIVLGLGIGILPKVVFGVMVGIFVIIFNTTAGLRQVEPRYVRLAESLGYRPDQIFWRVSLPAAAPTILAGLRLGFGYTIIGVMTAELLVVNDGFGFMLDWASFNYFTPQLYALIILALSIGVFGNLIFSFLERRWVR